MRIKVINPVISQEIFPDVVQSFAKFSIAKKVDVEFISFGPPSIESELDAAMALPGLMDAALQAQNNGYDGLIINCMCDPGLQPCRELLKIPVAAPAEASVHYASILTDRFSIITTVADSGPVYRGLCSQYGLSTRLASVRAVDIPVLELEKNWPMVLDRFLSSIYQARKEDGVGAVIPGCTGISSLIEEIERGLKVKGIDVVVIDPVKAVVLMLESLIRLGLPNCRRAPIKQIRLPVDFAAIKQWSETNESA